MILPPDRVSEIDLTRLQRVAIVGTSCSGKTTLAQSLSRTLAVPHIELDVLHWGPNWTPSPHDDFRASVEAAIAGPSWVLDGNYAAVRNLVWGRATTVVWLNYSFVRIYSRALSRTARRILTREDLFSGNRESLRQAVDPDWIPWWVLRTFWKNRRKYPALFREPAAAHLQVLELTKPKQAEHLLEVCAG